MLENSITVQKCFNKSEKRSEEKKHAVESTLRGSNNKILIKQTQNGMRYELANIPSERWKISHRKIDLLM